MCIYTFFPVQLWCLEQSENLDNSENDRYIYDDIIILLLNMVTHHFKCSLMNIHKGSNEGVV